jgi:hypothetical protein
MTMYNSITGVEPLPPGQGVSLPHLQEDQDDRAKMVKVLIHLGWCDEILPQINNIDDPVEGWETLRDGLDNISETLSLT